ncbi:hypothetical protein KA005_58445 [bacterium]|nr:hypothetical protein [bacterium]
MNRDLYFTEEQLGKLKRRDLLKIASYYKLGFDRKASKKQLRELIWNSFHAPEIVEMEDMEVPVSVRIRRVKESNR